MKKVTIAFMLTAFVAAASCVKDNDKNIAGNFGVWTFKGTSYTAVTCQLSSAATGYALEAFSGNGNTTGESNVVVTFYGMASPLPGIYLIENKLPSAGNQVYITTVTAGGASSYLSTGGNGKQTVALTLVNGKLNLSGAGVEMTNYSDSSVLSLNITQQ